LYSAEGCGETYATSTPLPTFAVEPSITNQTESKFDFQFPITLALIKMIIFIVKLENFNKYLNGDDIFEFNYKEKIRRIIEYATGVKRT
jgi:hypothetical protein